MLLLVLVTTLLIVSSCSAKPNIIFIIADDLGWNDVGFHGSNQIPTPNIDALAYSGVILNNYYTMPVCTPSRAALMTGRHPIHTGMQHRVIFAYEPWGLALEEKLLPEYLKEQGYSTSLVGKWHLGHFSRAYTPTHRGFDSHFGFWSGRIDYYDHTAEETGRYWGYDLRRGENVTREGYGRYTTSLLTEEALRVVAEHDKTEGPLFLCLAHLAVHSGNPYLPLQAPPQTVQQFSHIKDEKRRVYAAMLTEMDRSVGAVIAALGKRDMLQDSIVIFTTDNGGPAGGFNLNAASNWPLRGTKDGMWEGGIRGAALIWSPMLSNTPRVSTQLMHIQDWLPTLMTAINASLPNSVASHLDGRDLWPALNDPDLDTYDEVLYVIDNERGLANLRQGDWKLFKGTVYDGKYDRVLGPSGREGSYDFQALHACHSTQALGHTPNPLPGDDVIRELRSKATVACDQEEDPEFLCTPLQGELCLFNISSDPCETHNLAASHPEVVEALLTRLSAYNSTYVPTRNKPLDPASNPKYWDYTWNNWMDFPLPPPMRPPRRPFWRLPSQAKNYAKAKVKIM